MEGTTGSMPMAPSGCHFCYYKVARKRGVKEEEEGMHVHYYIIEFYCRPITAGFVSDRSNQR